MSSPSQTTNDQNLTVISIEEATPGMALAEAVYDHNGRMLVSEGAIITTHQQRRMRSHGITHVAIYSAHPPKILPITQSPEHMPIEDFLKQRQADPFMEALMRAARDRVAHLGLLDM